MNDILIQPVSTGEAEDETTLKQIWVEIDRLNGQMAQDRKDIERLKTESELLKIKRAPFSPR